MMGDVACAMGGVGSCACDEAGGVMGERSAMGAGAVRSDCSERHVVKMLPMAVWVDS